LKQGIGEHYCTITNVLILVIYDEGV